ncbi:fungal-specific transcription factor domain-containing protein [Penicillium herquei]|nr:fungal-specific transcription factor domain-containing protein [Penicillium herquei]
MDLQEAIGKNGPENASKAFSRLKMWFAMKPSHLQPESNEVGSSLWTSDSFAMNASSEAIKLIELGLRTQNKHSSVPLSIISLFLSHVAIWAIAKTAPLEIKALIPALVNPNTLEEASWTRLQKVLDLVISGSESSNMSDAGLILKQCANTLTKLGYWGASLNLAFLLQQLTEAS